MSSPLASGLDGASVLHRHVISARAGLDTAAPGAASWLSQQKVQPVVDEPSSVSTPRYPLDAGEALALLRRWSRDRGCPSHLRELSTHYRDWPAVALVLGELTSAELRRPGRSAR